MHRVFPLLLFAAIACSPGPSRGPTPSPLAGLPRQQKVQVRFAWNIPNAIPPHEITDSLQVAAIMAILDAPGDWRFERAWPMGEQLLILAEADGHPLFVHFCPRTIVVRGQDRRMIRTTGPATYDSLLLLTGSRPYDAPGDTTTARRDRLCHVTDHGSSGSLASVVVLGFVAVLMVAGARLFDSWKALQQATS